jgi:hypothetical protein
MCVLYIKIDRSINQSVRRLFFFLGLVRVCLLTVRNVSLYSTDRETERQDDDVPVFDLIRDDRWMVKSKIVIA